MEVFSRRVMEEFSATLQEWYHTHKRTLPWREHPSPYRIWLSEIILQQTRVSQGTAYYHRFIETFPTVHDLARAQEDEVLKLWQGLGYYNRARNLHAAAKQVVFEWEGQFPTSYEGLLKLKGVGPYTAAAIASIAYQLPHAVVDGNVIRVIARYFAIDASVSESATLRHIQEKADALLDPDHAGDHNQAMMEFGALLCTAKSPRCEQCPFRITCKSHQLGIEEQLPKKTRKQKRRSRYFHYLVPFLDGKTVLHQRSNDDIWSSLFEFPLIESPTDEALDEAQLNAAFPSTVRSLVRVNRVSKHVLSHQDLHARFYHIEANTLDFDDSRIVTLAELHTFALPRLIDRYLENYRVHDGSKRH